MAIATLGLHLVSDVLIGMAYFSIPLCLFYFVRRAQDIPFKKLFVLFSLFIISCGITHFTAVWTLWHPAYWLSGTFKAITAIVSVYTSLELIPVLPKALTMKSPVTLQLLNERLQEQIRERTAAEAEISKLNQLLESRVEERTLSLAKANRQLTQEVTVRRQAEASLTIANNQLAEQLTQLETLQATQTCINELSDTLQLCDSWEEAFRVSAELIKRIFPDCRGYIFITETTPSHHLQCVAQWGKTEKEAIAPLEEHECWGIRKSVMHISLQEIPGLCCEHLKEPAVMTICVPLISQGDVLGLLQLESESKLPILTRSYAKNVADQLALSFKNLKLKEELKVQSYSDPLTGLYNRRYLEIYLSRQMLHHHQQEHTCLVLFDVDHFKAVNDNYGHDAGDVVLESLARFLQANVRDNDLVCRYGGEEILLVFPTTTLLQACQRAEMLRQGITQLPLRHHTVTLPCITVSAGVACFSPEMNTVPKVLKAVDEALYKAKDQGRDRVVCLQES